MSHIRRRGARVVLGASAVALGVSLAMSAVPTQAAVTPPGGGSSARAAGRIPAGAVARKLTPKQVLTAQVTKAKNAAGVGGVAHVVVRLKDAPLASYTGSVAGFKATSPLVTGAKRLDPRSADGKKYLKYLDGRISTFESRARLASPTARFGRRFETVVGGVGMTVPTADLGQDRRRPAGRGRLPGHTRASPHGRHPRLPRDGPPLWLRTPGSAVRTRSWA